jgi:hypothetical protein
VGVNLTVDYTPPNLKTRRMANFVNQIMISAGSGDFSAPGDSGSLVLSTDFKLASFSGVDLVPHPTTPSTGMRGHLVPTRVWYRASETMGGQSESQVATFTHDMCQTFCDSNISVDSFTETNSCQLRNKDARVCSECVDALRFRNDLPVRGVVFVAKAWWRSVWAPRWN